MIRQRLIPCVLLCFLALLGKTVAAFENHQGEKFPFSIAVNTQDNPSPTVLISHGSICRGSQEVDWAARFRSLGLNTVIVDHCTLRRIQPHPAAEPPPLRVQDRVNDYIVAAEWVKAQKWHDGKIVVFGISRGGEAVVRATDARFNRGYRGDEGLAELDLFIALYPACNYFPRSPRKPILIMHGEEDNLALFRRCEYETLEHQNYTIKTYPNAHHGFDVMGPDNTGYNKFIGNYVLSRFNPRAASQSVADIRAFLSQHLK